MPSKMVTLAAVAKSKMGGAERNLEKIFWKAAHETREIIINSLAKFQESF